jgi:CheY-like chemotaxis protein
MGLAMVRAFVEQAGGEIDVHSRINDGTEITLALPRSATAVPDAPNPSETVVTPDSLPPGNETILVCEDDAPIRQLALRTLSRLGYNVLPAADAENALAIAADFERPIDLLLTDVIMPGMSGDALASRLRARYADLRVLFVSGYTADHLDEKSLDGPQSRLLSKPFTPAQLAGAVRAILDNSAANTL